ncbi:DNA topoisomerase VI subunit B [Candidatus Hydrogenedentota bacterium]
MATKKPRRRESAESMAKNQRSISISEFFAKNRHLLGFDNPKRALLTTVKEAVDNALDACEEAGILPDITTTASAVENGNGNDRYTVIVEDNGPGIVKSQIPNIFGKLLYGSKFHRLKMSRGQQGIGISAAGMYGLITTGRPIKITSRTSPNRPAHHYELQIDTKKNRPEIIVDQEVEWDKDHGTRVEIELEAKYQKGRQSIDEYLEQTAITNPHVNLKYISPDGEEFEFPRSSEELPPEAKEIKPHPYGVELGVLIDMAKNTKGKTLKSFLMHDFSRVSARVAEMICEEAELSVKARPKGIARREADNLFEAIKRTKIMNPPTDCISPIGQERLLQGLNTVIKSDFQAAVTRPPSVYRGNPFQIEAAIAYGGDIQAEGLGRVLRFANRVPLLYQQSSCASFKSILSTSWRNYGIQQSQGALPSGPIMIIIHMASVWVPFTSESKEAIAHYPEIIKEMRLALQECGRKLGGHISRRKREAESLAKKSYIEKYIPHIGDALKEILDLSDGKREETVEILKDVLERSRKM